MAKNIDVIEAFVNGGKAPKTQNLRVIDDGEVSKLVNYDTVIAQRVGNEFTVNNTKYSVSTSKIQGQVRMCLSGVDYKTVENVFMGASRL